MWTLAVIVIIGFSVWGFSEYSSIKMANESTGNITVFHRNPVSVSTEGWQTYRNEKLGFEFKYPQGWYLNFEEPDVEVASVPKSDYVRGFGIPAFGNVWVEINEWGSKGLDGESATDIYEDIKIIELKKFATAEDLIYKVSLSFYQGDIRENNYRSVFNQIFSTFKFTGQHIYRNDELGFEVKYPDDWKLEVLYSSPNNSVIQGFFISRNESRLAILPQGGWDYGAVCTVSDSVINGRLVKVKNCERSKGILTLYHFVNTIPSSWLACGDELKSCNRIDLFAVNEEDLNILNKIFSTFKFIEPIDISNWQTYRNEKYGFEFKYPSNWKSNWKLENNYLTFSTKNGYMAIFSVGAMTPATRDFTIEEMRKKYDRTATLKDIFIGSEAGLMRGGWMCEQENPCFAYYEFFSNGIWRKGFIFNFMITNLRDSDRNYYSFDLDSFFSDDLSIVRKILSTFKFIK